MGMQEIWGSHILIDNPTTKSLQIELCFSSRMIHLLSTLLFEKNKELKSSLSKRTTFLLKVHRI
jgi:hypothetical protein